MCCRNKRGVTTVFLTIVVGAMVTMVIGFVVLAGRTASWGMAESVFNLAGRSVLSEFDKELKERYGFIAFIGDETAVGEKILRYADVSFADDDNVLIDGIKVDMKGDCLYDRDVFEEEIKEIVEYDLRKMLDRREKKEAGQLITGERVLRNKQIISSLPSSAYTGQKGSMTSLISLIKNIRNIDGMFKTGTTEYAKMVYIFDRFGWGTDGTDDPDSFFQNEVEYIIEGKYSDKDNVKEFRKDFKELRTALNLLYLAADREKMAAAAVLAQFLTPGPEAEATKAVIVAAWAAIEADNDWDLISSGRAVPLFKTKANWGTDISMVQDGRDDMSLPAEEKGQHYDDYLKLFLQMVPDEVETARIMDLIEINLKGTYNGAFDIKNCYTGFAFDAEVNGKDLKFEESY